MEIKWYPLTPRVETSIGLFSKSNSNGYGGWMEDKNEAITDDDAQKWCVNGNKNIYDHYRWVINNVVIIDGENKAGLYHHEQNIRYVGNMVIS